MKKVLITGAGGFIAKKLAKVMKESGFFVIGTSRTPGKRINYDEIYYGVFGEPLDEVFDAHKIDAVVHCAYDKDDRNAAKSTEGTYIWAEQAEKNSVGLQIFMSTISADEDALSPYGLKKYELEKWFIDHNQVIFRLGLVVGNEGLFGRIISTVKKSPIIPLIDGGRTLIYLSDADTLGKIVHDTILNHNKIERGKIIYLQQDPPVLFKDVLREIRKHYNLWRIFIPVPYAVLSIVLYIIEKLKFVKLGIDTNNLKGMRQVRQKSFKSDLPLLGYSGTPLDVLIKKTLEQ